MRRSQNFGEIRKPPVELYWHILKKANNFTFYGPEMECISAAKNSLQEYDSIEEVNRKALASESLF